MRVAGLAMELEDDGNQNDKGKKEEIRETMAALQERAEVGRTEGLVIDRVLTENLLVDPSIAEFWDYEQADWMVQIVPMKKAVAEGLYGYKLDKATYSVNIGTCGLLRQVPDAFFPAANRRTTTIRKSVFSEIWDKQSQRVYTMAEGCEFWLRATVQPSEGR